MSSDTTETMLHTIKRVFEDSIRVKTEFLARSGTEIANIAQACIESLRSGGKLLFAGNGGSAADAQHLAAEFVGRYFRDRKALAAIALTTDTSALTAIANDFGYAEVFRRQVEGLGRTGDVLFAISTSGNSENVLAAAAQAKTQGLTVVAFTGGTGGKLAAVADHALIVPADRADRIQESHILAGHVVCDLIDEAFSGDAT